MPDLPIRITSAQSGQAKFSPNPQPAQQGDSASWGNETNTTHQIVVQASPPYDSGPIPAGASSGIYDCGTLGSINYSCTLHPNEKGTIIVTAPPAQHAININDKSPAYDPASQAANPGDLIYWQNNSVDAHQPWPTDAQYHPLSVSSGSPLYLTDEIQPGDFSQTYEAAEPQGNPQTWTVYYYCKLHPNETNERGTIVVTPPSS